MEITNTKARRAVWLSAFFLFGLVACEKFDEKNVGNVLLPEGDKAGIFQRTFDLRTSTFLPEEIATDELTVMILGDLYDPVFGNTKAGIFSQFLLAQNNISFGTSPQLDSVVFSMGLSTVYGDSTSTFTFSVEEASENYPLDSTHYSNTEVVTFGENLIFPGRETTQFSASDSVINAQDTLAPQVHFRLKDDFGQKILNASAENLADNTAFIEFFKGLRTTATLSSGNIGALYYLLPTGANSKIVFYYTNQEDTTQQRFEVGVNAVAERFSTFSNDYTGTPVEQEINGTGDSSSLFVQSAGGVSSLIEFPNIKEALDSSYIAINKAELQFSFSASDAQLPIHSSVFVARLDDNGETQLIDDQLEGSAHFNGFLVASDSNVCSINITRYFQQVLSGTLPDNGLHLLPIGAGVSANRTVFGGHTSVDKKPKLVITYTKP